MSFLADLIDFIFPPRLVCPLCASQNKYASICPRCLEKITAYRSEPVCVRCGRYFLQLEKHIQLGDEIGFCYDCAKTPRKFYMARAAGPYEGDLKGAVQRLKYSGKRDLAAHLTEMMFQSMVANNCYLKTQIVTAVPLSPERMRYRGFNQAELLAVRLADRLAVPFLPVLRKVKDTLPQTSLNRAERKENLVGAFQLTDQDVISGKMVMVVDDVITTGSTLDIVSEILVSGGVATVICIAAAAGRTRLSVSGR